MKSLKPHLFHHSSCHSLIADGSFSPNGEDNREIARFFVVTFTQPTKIYKQIIHPTIRGPPIHNYMEVN